MLLLLFEEFSFLMETLLCALANTDWSSSAVGSSELQSQLDSSFIRKGDVSKALSEISGLVTDDTDVSHLATGPKEFPDSFFTDA